MNLNVLKKIVVTITIGAFVPQNLFAQSQAQPITPQSGCKMYTLSEKSEQMSACPMIEDSDFVKSYSSCLKATQKTNCQAQAGTMQEQLRILEQRYQDYLNKRQSTTAPNTGQSELFEFKSQAESIFQSFETLAANRECGGPVFINGILSVFSIIMPQASLAAGIGNNLYPRIKMLLKMFRNQNAQLADKLELCRANAEMRDLRSRACQDLALQKGEETVRKKYLELEEQYKQGQSKPAFGIIHKAHDAKSDIMAILAKSDVDVGNSKRAQDKLQAVRAALDCSFFDPKYLNQQSNREYAASYCQNLDAAIRALESLNHLGDIESQVNKKSQIDQAKEKLTLFTRDKRNDLTSIILNLKPGSSRSPLTAQPFQEVSAAVASLLMKIDNTGVPVSETISSQQLGEKAKDILETLATSKGISENSRVCGALACLWAEGQFDSPLNPTDQILGWKPLATINEQTWPALLANYDRASVRKLLDQGKTNVSQLSKCAGKYPVKCELSCEPGARWIHYSKKSSPSNGATESNAKAAGSL